MPKPSTPSAPISSGTVASATTIGMAEPLKFQIELRSSIAMASEIGFDLIVLDADGNEWHCQRQAEQHHGPEFNNGGADQECRHPEQEASKSSICHQACIAYKHVAM